MQIDNIFVTASWFEQAKSLAGINGVSQVWTEHPEWYIWVKDAPGAYGLILEDTDVFSVGNETCEAGQFVLKCYPFPNHPVYETFSEQEKHAVSGSLFDHTNTPRLETKAQIPETFFTVGGITLIVDRKNNESLLSFESLDRMMVNGKSRPTAQESGNAADKGEDRCIRRVPGWQVGWRFIDSLVSLLAFYRKRHPGFISATRSPGIEQWVDESGTFECRQSEKARYLSLSLMFVEKSSTGSAIQKIWHSQLEADEKIIFEQCLCEPCDQKIFFDAENSFSINPIWWELASADYQSEISSTCGCSDAHHIHMNR
jgi:hypothetical protein